MTYTEGVGVRPEATSTFSPPIAEYHDTVRWGPIFAGIVVAIVAQLLLSALGAVVGGFAAGEATARAIGTGVGIWAVISLLLALFLGGLTMAASCGPMNSKTAMLNATIMWAATLVISGWLLASNVAGTFGLLASTAGNVVGGAAAGAPAAVNQIQQPGGASLPTQQQIQQGISNAVPSITGQEADQYAANASKTGLWFIVGTLLALVAALIGSTVGAKKPRAVVR